MSQSKETVPNGGVYNPSGYAFIGFGPIFLAMVPVTSWLTQPGGLVEQAVHGFVNTAAFIGTAGAATTLSKAATIPALSAVYIAFTYALTGAASVAGVAAGAPKGRSNKHPRLADANLRGLPLRLKSAHLNLMEMFPGFALTAALAVALAPHDQQIINLLGLHVLAKVAVFYPSYLLNVDAPRSLAHLFATSSVINVAWRLAIAAGH